jgi:heat-inducible transcriptional repressor
VRLLSAREERILGAIIDLYMASGRAVSSGSVAKHIGREWSPASIRAVMVDLEREGLLASVHASSGRTPTEIALRRFALEAVAQAEGVTVPAFEQGPPDRLLRGAARWLAEASNATAVLSAPRLDMAVLRQVRFFPLRERHLLAVLVTREGLRSECVIETPSGPSIEELERVNDLLAERVDGGTLREVRDELEKELRAAARCVDRERAAALWLAFQAVGAPRPEVLVEGEMNLLSHPALDVDRMRATLVALRDKERLADLLDRTLSHAGPVVWLGESSGRPELRGLALIAMPYDAGGALGTIAVLGPARLDYAKVAERLVSAARALTTTLCGLKA